MLEQRGVACGGDVAGDLVQHLDRADQQHEHAGLVVEALAWGEVVGDGLAAAFDRCVRDTGVAWVANGHELGQARVTGVRSAPHAVEQPRNSHQVANGLAGERTRHPSRWRQLATGVNGQGGRSLSKAGS